jgi:LPS export ABC transporter protein LptC
MRNVKTRFTAVTFIAVGLLGLWSAFKSGRDEQMDEEHNPHFVDAFIRDFTMTQMGANGEPAYVLQASYLEHFNDTEESVISNPLLNLSDPKANWKIGAMQGNINRDGSWLELDDNVVMQQTNTPNPIRLETSHMRINTSSLSAVTNRVVKIHSANQQITSRGMEYNSRRGTLEFRSNVRGTYDFGG